MALLESPKCCSNCASIIKNSKSLFSYFVRGDCAKQNWPGENFYGDGDYIQDVTDRQVCSDWTPGPEYFLDRPSQKA